MLNKQQLNQEIEQLNDMRDLMLAFEEIAVGRMRKIRASVLKNREFITGLTQIYQEVKSSYRNELILIMKQKKVQDLSKMSLISRNGKSVAVLLSTNTGLYGSIVRETYKSFVDFARRTKSDIVIIGKLGKVMFEADPQNSKGQTYEYFDFPDTEIKEDLSTKLLESLVKYEKILVFYGQFQNVVVQKPAILDIYGNEAKIGIDQDSNVKYFFEPSLEKIVIFFETQIFSSIFNQTLHESNLAKNAARILALDTATESVKDQLSKFELEKRIVKHRVLNKKQLDSLSGMSLW